MTDLQHESVSDLFDGDTIGPQFAIALKAFLQQNSIINIATGIALVPSASVNHAIAHGLNRVPKMITLSNFPGGTQGSPLNNRAWLSDAGGGTSADATNFYVDSFDAGSGVYVKWSAQ